MAIRDELSSNHAIVLRNLLLCMSGIIKLFTDGVTTYKSRWHWVIYGDLGKVKVWIDEPNLLQAVIKTFTIVDGARINKRLRGLKLHNGVNFGLLPLLMKGHQLCLLAFLSFLCLLLEARFLLQFFSDSRHLLIEGTDNLLVLISLLVLNFLTLSEPTDHPFLSDAPIQKHLYAHQCLRPR